MHIPFYFDYACPWAYLGSCRVEAYFRDLGVAIDFRPVSLMVLYEAPADGGAPPKPGPRKQRNTRRLSLDVGRQNTVPCAILAANASER